MAKTIKKKAAPKKKSYPFSSVFLKKETLSEYDKDCIVELMQDHNIKTATKAVLYAVTMFKKVLDHGEELRQELLKEQEQHQQTRHELRQLIQNLKREEQIKKELSDMDLYNQTTLLKLRKKYDV